MTGIGIDIEDVSRFKNKIKNKRFLELIFTKKEMDYCMKKKSPDINFTGKFCAKEAVIKAYDKNLNPKDIEIINLKSSRLAVKIKGRLNKKI